VKRVVSSNFPNVIRAERSQVWARIDGPARSGRLEGEWDCQNRNRKDKTL